MHVSDGGGCCDDLALADAAHPARPNLPARATATIWRTEDNIPEILAERRPFAITGLPSAVTAMRHSAVPPGSFGADVPFR